MKKLFVTLIIAVALTSLPSCITSLQPLVSPDKVTTDNRVTGSWAHDGDTYTITPVNKSPIAQDLLKKEEGRGHLEMRVNGTDSIMNSKAYVIEFGSEGVTYYLLASLVKLNGQLFASLYPGTMNDTKRNDDSEDPFIFNADYLPGFTFAKVEINDPSSMTLKFVDGTFVTQQLEQGNLKLKHESNSLFGTIMITASTEELQRFVSKYSHDDRIFSKAVTFKLTRPANP